jgi:hypothetical protein
MKTAIFTTTLLSAIALVSASPIEKRNTAVCGVEGNSLYDATTQTWPYWLQTWGSVASPEACGALGAAFNGSYSTAYLPARKECHAYSDIVDHIGFHTTTSGFKFSDNCCFSS